MICKKEKEMTIQFRLNSAGVSAVENPLEAYREIQNPFRE